MMTIHFANLADTDAAEDRVTPYSLGTRYPELLAAMNRDDLHLRRSVRTWCERNVYIMMSA